LDNVKLEKICESLVEHAITVKHSEDNVSVIIITMFESLKPDLLRSSR
jgi:serine/threonine protein phosphatase PrpC